MPEKLSRKKIIEKAAELFIIQGYRKTNMNDIAKACQVKKATLYHHVPSRRMLTIEVLKLVISNFTNNYLKSICDKPCTAPEKLILLLTTTKDHFVAAKGRCLISILLMEAAREIPEISLLAKSHFTDWANVITLLLCSQYDIKTSQQLAEKAVSQLYGAIFYSSLFQDYQALYSTIENIGTLLTEKSDNDYTNK